MKLEWRGITKGCGSIMVRICEMDSFDSEEEIFGALLIMLVMTSRRIFLNKVGKSSFQIQMSLNLMFVVPYILVTYV
jgi:hypothetical protein